MKRISIMDDITLSRVILSNQLQDCLLSEMKKIILSKLQVEGDDYRGDILVVDILSELSGEQD